MVNIPQGSFFSEQDVVTPDIELCYNKIIQDIDSFRSRFDGTSVDLTSGASVNPNIIDKLFVGNDGGSTSIQESRCHAFYRMIGFPVVSGDGSRLYSPGFDPDFNRDSDRISEHLNIAFSAVKKLKSILNKREIYAKNSINVFQNKDANGSALAISSIYVRPFDKQFKQGLGPLDIDQQESLVSIRNNVSVDFDEDVQFITESIHVLKPFIVDPRIEMTVMPAANRICAPFLLDKSKTQLAKNNYLKRPYIERVMRVRFKNTNVLAPSSIQESVNGFVDDLISFIKSNSEITQPNLVEITGDTLKALHKSEVVVFSKFTRILEAFVLDLVESFIEIEKIRSYINWKPIPNVRGPEFGCELNNVSASDITNNKVIETQINNLQLHKFLEESEFDIGKNSPDLGNFSFSNVDDIVFGSIKNVSQFYDKQINTLTKKRENLGNRANGLLRKIEIITGEFSGLGLLDVIAIQAALWIIKPEALMGLIDDAAITRMQTDNSLRSELSLPGAKLDPQSSLEEFEKKLSEIYVLINSFYQDAINNNGTNR